MPSKKAAPAEGDQSRKSDVSTARFVPIDGVQTPEPTTEPSAAAAAADDSIAETQSQGQASDKKDGGKEKERDAVTIEDLALPKSIITRLAKGVLPPNTQIQANAILAMSKSATVFINYLASHANEHTFNAGKKTIAPADVFKALDDIEFGFLKEPLEAEFAKFQSLQAEKRNAHRKKPNAAKPEDADMADAAPSASKSGGAPTPTTTTNGAAAGDEEPRAAKKQRVVAGDETEEEIDATVDERDEDVDDDDEEDEAEEEEEEEHEDEDSGDETQDALEDKPRREDRDEALDGDESD
ncbi:histone-like transcription factor (CBF/NF-Y) and archaeal histone domain-containing protein [Sarocladium implicatum]|nr:histone-like transcription factor (CBF/NF-Y) and archaeal histone domain-containing protein [Sarocladium implicatum]